MTLEPEIVAAQIINLIAILGFLGLVAWAMVAIFVLVVRKSAGSKSTSADETRLIQELHHQAMEMEKRIESLETLLLENEQQTSRKP